MANIASKEIKQKPCPSFDLRVKQQPKEKHHLIFFYLKKYCFLDKII
jgi:hypothetical protein